MDGRGYRLRNVSRAGSAPSRREARKRRGEFIPVSHFGLVAALKSGKKLDDFLINRAA